MASPDIEKRIANLSKNVSVDGCTYFACDYKDNGVCSYVSAMQADLRAKLNGHGELVTKQHIVDNATRYRRKEKCPVGDNRIKRILAILREIQASE